jgi:hypothetical protein
MDSRKQKKDKSDLIAKIFIFFVFGIGIGYSIYRQLYIAEHKDEQRYTVATIKEKYIVARQGEGKVYTYRLAQKEYEGVCKSKACIESEIGTRYYVRTWIDRPSWSDLFEEYPVPENIHDPPTQGWTLEELQKIDPYFKPEDTFIFKPEI